LEEETEIIISPMTHLEFNAWLTGFLEDKLILDTLDIQTIKEKMAEIKSVNVVPILGFHEII